MLFKTVYEKMRILWMALLLLQVSNGHGQSSVELNSIKKGDQFQKETIVNSNILIRYRNNNLLAGTKGVITELYSVVDTANAGFSFKITTTQVLDTVNSNGEEVYYNSASFTDNNSAIQHFIQDVIKRTLLVKVDSKGVVTEVEDNLTGRQDPFVKMLGLFPTYLHKEEHSNFVTGYHFSSLQGNGFSIADSSMVNNRKTLTNYTISAQNDSTTSIHFSQKITDSLVNINTNGLLTINNQSGLIIERVTKSVSSEEQVFNDLTYSIIRKTAKTERFRKL